MLSITSKALVVGCGGVGSEMAKLLVNAGCQVTVLDCDRVDVTNLNRQFLFVESDVGEFKAEVVAKKIKCSGIVKRIEEADAMLIGQFDVIFGCLDNVSSRMELNYLFLQSRCPLLIDCGVEGFKAHSKRVTRSTSCLYCIRDLYLTDNTPYICSLRGSASEITPENRNAVLKSIVFKFKENHRESNSSNEKEAISLIVQNFNEMAPAGLTTTEFEVEGIFKGVIPNVCTMNSICAGLGFLQAFNTFKEDFVYFDFTDEIAHIDTLEIDKDRDCFVCNILAPDRRKIIDVERNSE